MGIDAKGIETGIDCRQAEAKIKNVLEGMGDGPRYKEVIERIEVLLREEKKMDNRSFAFNYREEFISLKEEEQALTEKAKAGITKVIEE